MSVDTGGNVTVIEGRNTESSAIPEVSDVIVQAYGKDKIEDFTRQQETQNYYILSSDQLDSDEAIEMVERTPAFKRDKRKATVQRKPETEPETKKADPDSQIIFYRDDK